MPSRFALAFSISANGASSSVDELSELLEDEESESSSAGAGTSSPEATFSANFAASEISSLLPPASFAAAAPALAICAAGLPSSLAAMIALYIATFTSFCFFVLAAFASFFRLCFSSSSSAFASSFFSSASPSPSFFSGSGGAALASKMSSSLTPAALAAWMDVARITWIDFNASASPDAATARTSAIAALRSDKTDSFFLLNSACSAAFAFAASSSAAFFFASSFSFKRLAASWATFI
mmetsp:Transcript_8242/g.19388  ORF Transcript_8242/g.19388 Transcript_8242/m.19388 type:complete len:239 (-) Transcript_8242:490-1206(-)